MRPTAVGCVVALVTDLTLPTVVVECVPPILRERVGRTTEHPTTTATVSFGVVALRRDKVETIFVLVDAQIARGGLTVKVVAPSAGGSNDGQTMGSVVGMVFVKHGRT